MVLFSELGLKKNILENLANRNFSEATEVQAKIIPIALKGENAVFTAPTGSGKTLAYTIGFLNRLNPKQGLQMLVVVPTRELCNQVALEMKRVCFPMNLNIGKLIGGRPLARDIPTLTKKNQIIVATPGRLIEHINTKRIKVGDVKFLVFDESDQMFDDGFFDDCVYLLERISMTAQILLASATITDKVNEFAHNGIQNYHELSIGSIIPKTVTQEKLFCPIKEKNDLLVELFSLHKFKKALVFTNTKIKVETITQYLQQHRLKADSISSDLDQKHREERLKKFTNGEIDILVATDVAARGLHIPYVDLVLNYDVPTRTEFYVHRIGRTGRTNKGRALTFICPEDEDRFVEIEYRYFLEVQELDIMFKKVKHVESEEEFTDESQ